ncbi:tetratricopeptide repeat protein 8 [Copidosoma floridanum]|uniref:tetratricopeptide repeat protein 8 n=1 Tax=Copidosoma floridanum TaxID=29053 RepID=UPI000C6F7EA5|nr:tetratricopeptide repeat protein 8 [Copidosoma floridanum]
MELFQALSLFRRRKFEDCAAKCTELLRKSPLDQAVWILKMRALTLQVYVDDIEAEEEGLAEGLLDNDTIASMPRPGTSLKNPGTVATGQAFRPRTQTEHLSLKALDLAVQATQACQYKDWWWKVQLGKCYYLLGLTRDAEQQFRSALRDCRTIDVVLRLVRVFIKLDQPLAALEQCKKGLECFPNDVSILTEMARIFEGMHNVAMSVKYYKTIAQEDASHVEAIATIGLHNFYNDQPEIALRYYRRLLQMGVYNAELFNNLGMCCFYAQQYDFTISCFERALSLATDENVADVWYSISHVAICLGDLMMASDSLKLAINADNKHAPSYNNLGVLEMKSGNVAMARTYFHAAANIANYMYEPHFNSSFLAYNTGDLQTSYISVQKALKAYPDHRDSKELLEKLQQYFTYMS